MAFQNERNTLLYSHMQWTLDSRFGKTNAPYYCKFYVHESRHTYEGVMSAKTSHASGVT